MSSRERTLYANAETAVFSPFANTARLPPPPPLTPTQPHQILQSLCIQFLLDLTAFPREIKHSAYAKFWEADEVYYHGRCADGE